MFPSFAIEDIGFFTLAMLMGLCNVAGIGGGAIDVPIVMLFFRFSTKQAIALSNMIIFMGAVVRFIYNFNDKNPSKPGVVVVDYSIATVIMATTLVGN